MFRQVLDFFVFGFVDPDPKELQKIQTIAGARVSVVGIRWSDSKNVFWKSSAYAHTRLVPVCMNFLQNIEQGKITERFVKVVDFRWIR